MQDLRGIYCADMLMCVKICDVGTWGKCCMGIKIGRGVDVRSGYGGARNGRLYVNPDRSD